MYFRLVYIIEYKSLHNLHVCCDKIIFSVDKTKSLMNIDVISLVSSLHPRSYSGHKFFYCFRKIENWLLFAYSFSGKRFFLLVYFL